MSSSGNLTNEKEEDKTKQADDVKDITRSMERRNAVVLEPEDLAAIFPELTKKNRTQKELDSV